MWGENRERQWKHLFEEFAIFGSMVRITALNIHLFDYKSLNRFLCTAISRKWLNRLEKKRNWTNTWNDYYLPFYLAFHNVYFVWSIAIYHYCNTYGWLYVSVGGSCWQIYTTPKERLNAMQKNNKNNCVSHYWYAV